MENSYVLQLTKSFFSDFHVCFCGTAECYSNHSFGPAVRPNYIIHFITSGKGLYQVGNKTYELSEGQGFLIEPEVLTYYKADEEEPWSYIWIGFAGQRAKECLTQIGLNSNHLIFQSVQKDKLTAIVEQMLIHKSMSTADQFRLQSLLCDFFSILSEDVQIDRAIRDADENHYIQEAIAFIRNHYFSGISVQDIADYICVNRSYLYKLFEEHLQMSPKDFLTQFRISRSKEMLAGTDLSIDSIALSCGYHDALVYSKAFKKQMGVPPSVYRTKHKKEGLEKLKETF